MKAFASIFFAALVAASPAARAEENIKVVAGNGCIERQIDCADGHVLSGTYKLTGSDGSFIRSGSREFSFFADGVLYTGENDWQDINISSDNPTIVSMKSADGKLAVDLTYTCYPDLAIVTSAYVYDPEHTGCYATDHKYHRDHEESYDVIYERCMQMFDDLHAEAPDLFIDCTFETAGKLQLMDYGIAKHAEGNWLANVEEPAPAGALRVRELGWVRSPALPATSLVIGNQSLDQPMHLLAYKSLTGTLPIMLGDPRKLTKEERAEFKAWTSWIKGLEQRHGIMSFRQDIPGFGMPAVGCWDGFCRINTETRTGGLVGVFREGAAEMSRIVTVRDLDPDVTYSIMHGPDGQEIARMTGADLERKGFLVVLPEEYSGELFEISRQ